MENFCVAIFMNTISISGKVLTSCEFFSEISGGEDQSQVENCKEEIVKEIIYFLIINLIYQSWIPSKSFVSNRRIL